MTAGACVQLLEPGTVSICNTGIPLLYIGCFILKTARQGEHAAADGCTFPVISS